MVVFCSNFKFLLYIHLVPDDVGLSNLNLVSDDDVKKTVKGLASKKSKVHFGLTNNLVKDTTQYLVNLLTLFISNCFRQKKFSDILKIKKVHPIFKKGS